jgi:GTP-binding protein
LNRPAVAIVGLPNVGKSTLFNRLVGRRQALVGSEPGLTRDRIHAEARLAGRAVTLIDTGGIFAEAGEGLQARVRAQARVAIAQAAVILLLVSARDGAGPQERALAALLRRSGRRVLLVANKADHPDLDAGLGELHGLGLGEPIPISAEHGRGVAALASAVARALPPEEPEAASEEDALALAIVGRPNVGKSSLLNALVREERAIVSEVPGTTRDSIDWLLRAGDRRYRVIDTAGIRRPGRRDPTERLSVMQATRSLAEACVGLLVVDGAEGLGAQDLAVAGLLRRHRRPFVMLVNKWDLRPPGQPSRDAFRDAIDRRLRFARWAPALFISARTGLGLGRILPTVDKVWECSGTRIGAGRLNRLLQRLNREHAGRGRDGRPMRGMYAAQTGVHPPRFVVFSSGGGPPHFSYRRFVENRIRGEFGLDLTPVVVEWRGRG